jgi:DNA polymerase III subunit gamma/tau
MSYLVLARKWRPQRFEDLVGQEPISRILGNALSQGKIAHAYLFSGPRGVGKTSTARILAKALNCSRGPTAQPCGECPACKEISDGTSVDVMEIDGASNNSVNDIRDLRERVKYAPAGGRYKVYIIDEAHMLSDAAFNALLKTLEEPPSHVVFVLATTAQRKIPATVLSRCQHLPFRRITVQKIMERLQRISETEGIGITPGAIEMVARAAEGSMRDSLTILDQVSAFSSEVDESQVKDLLGMADFRALSELARAVIAGDREKILLVISELADGGTDFKSFTKDLMQFFRDLLVGKVTRAPEEILDFSDNEFAVINDILREASVDTLAVFLSEMIKAEADVRFASSPRIALEMSLIRASYSGLFRPVNEAVELIEAILAERGGASMKDPADGKSIRASETPIQKDGTACPGAGDGVTISEPLAADITPPEVTASATDITCGNAMPSDDTQSHSEAVRSDTERKDVLEAVIWKIGQTNHPLACKLAVAEGRMEGDTLFIAFNGGDSIHAGAVKRHIVAIEKAATEFMGREVHVKIETVKKRTQRRKEIREEILADPLVKEAMDLFGGRIVEIRPIESREKGGRDV